MPYLFMNNSDEVIELDDKKERDYELMPWQSTIDDNDEEYKFQTLFGNLYLTLLKAIADANFSELAKICEERLYGEFKDGVEYL